MRLNGDVALRQMRADDADAVLAAFDSDSEIQRQGTVRNHEEARAYTNRLIADGSRTRAFAIVDRDDLLIGLIGIDVDDQNLNGWFCYWMNASHRGHGITAQAAMLVADWALGEGGLHRLELGHRVNNPASARVASIAGFIHEGTEREKFLIDGVRVDVHVYSRLRTDPRPTGAARTPRHDDI